MEDVQQAMDLFQSGRDTPANVEFFTLREDILYRLREKHFDAVVVAMGGALGMEIAIGARDQSARLPLIWVSDQKEFGMQSYRLHVKSFLVTPLNPKKLRAALEERLKQPV